MLFDWFKTKSKDTKNEEQIIENASFSFLGTDMHSHFIPGIDDGSTSLELSIDMLKSMSEMGYKKIITTPHVMTDLYQNTPNTINNGLVILQNAVSEAGIEIEIKAGAEYYIDEYFINKLESGGLLPIHNKEILIEFSLYSEPPMLKDIIFKMMTRGYRPILAHPERYNYLYTNLDIYMDFKDRGCLLQLNILSLTGYYGAKVKKIAEELFNNKLFDYCGTDIHNENHIKAVKSILSSKIYNQLLSYPFNNRNL